MKKTIATAMVAFATSAISLMAQSTAPENKPKSKEQTEHEHATERSQQRANDGTAAPSADKAAPKSEHAAPNAAEKSGNAGKPTPTVKSEGRSEQREAAPSKAAPK